MQIVIFEAGVAGGLECPPAKSPPAHMGPPPSSPWEHGLLEEGWAMQWALVTDCLAWLHRSRPVWLANRRAATPSEQGAPATPPSPELRSPEPRSPEPQSSEPVCRCVDLLLADVPVPRPSTRSGRPTRVTVFWNRRHQELFQSWLGSRLDVPREGSHTQQFGDSPPEWSSGMGYLLRLDPATGDCQEIKPLRLPHPSWAIGENKEFPASPGCDGRGAIDSSESCPPGDRATDRSGPIAGSCRDHRQLEVVWVDGMAEVVDRWRKTVEPHAVTVLIAPQPDLQAWTRTLVASSESRLGLPAELLPLFEDKRFLTAVPSRVLRSSDEPNGESDAEAQVWFRQNLATTRWWTLKPTDRCGGADVWQIELSRPVPDWQTAAAVLRELRRTLPCATGQSQALLVSPWLEGQAGSLSLIANRNAWWCLPTCTQELEFQPLAVPNSLTAWVQAVQRVQYIGARWDVGPTPDSIGQWVKDQFVDRLTAEQRSQLRGWIGLDYVRSPEGRFHLIEVNPRLTSSYHRLRSLVW